ncbi:four and a half LIM domains protein 3-like [Paramacrobiotus metropolitanus]|uniref:four and a half LIM domains protein 3-like n=1 Tax=Paramacrobiotus metropolitanus TaxID=2943436 RepID=UPI0024459CBA|nr:four and a half LIM domains protein 3-like [Paramacrobiotus metropolitanus]
MNYTGERVGHQGQCNDIGQPIHRQSNLRTNVQGNGCSGCIEPIADGDHVHAKGRHFHRNCFDSAHSGECYGCGEKLRLTEPSVSVAVLGREWHTGCLSCGHCNNNITGQFQWANDLPLCEKCYRERIAPGCASCKEPILGDKLKAMNMYWHRDCFHYQLIREMEKLNADRTVHGIILQVRNNWTRS